MARRWTLCALAATSVLTTAPTAHADTFETPRAACTKIPFVDPVGDANPLGTGQVKGLDIREVYLRLTADQIQMFIKVEDLPTPAEMGPTDMKFLYTGTFKYAEKTFTFENLLVSTNGQTLAANTTTNLDPKPANYPRANMGTQANEQLPGATGSIDATSNYVVIAASRAKAEENLAAAIPNDAVFTDVKVVATHYLLSRKSDADTTTFTGDAAKWTVSDEYCFGPPPATMSALTTPAVQYTDSVVLSATLAKEDGTTKLAGKPVEFTVEGETGMPLVGTTDANGVATVTYKPTKPAGTYAVTASYPGDATDGKAKLTGSVVVKTEVTKFNALAVAKPSATTRTVTATLVDDDKKAVAGQKVDFYVNGKKVATVTTNTKGQAVYKGAKPTQYVQVKYAGLTGKYGAATSAKVKV